MRERKRSGFFFVLCSAMIVAFPGGPAAHVESDPQTSPWHPGSCQHLPAQLLTSALISFKKITQNYFWETIRGRSSCLPFSQTAEKWECAAPPCSSSLWVWASGFERRIEVPWWHLIPSTQSVQHSLEQSQVVLLHFVKNNPVRLSCSSPSDLVLPILFLNAFISEYSTDAHSHGQNDFPDGAGGVWLFWLMCHMELVLPFSL